MKVGVDVTASGRASILNPAEEQKFAEYIIQCARIRFPLSKQHVLMWVKRIIDVDGRSTQCEENMAS